MHVLSKSAAYHTRVIVLLLVLVAAGWLGGCTEDEVGEVDTTGSEETVQLPDWIERVHPDPGAEASPTPQVQVVHGVVGTREAVRLVVDGTDVTRYAEPRNGVVTYDPNRPPAPVELGPGTHEASALRVSLDELGEQHEVLERFDWQFTVQ